MCERNQNLTPVQKYVVYTRNEFNNFSTNNTKINISGSQQECGKRTSYLWRCLSSTYSTPPYNVPVKQKLWMHYRDEPNVRLSHSAEAEGLGRLNERVPNVQPKVVC